jgi:hypothetical protein
MCRGNDSWWGLKWVIKCSIYKGFVNVLGWVMGIGLRVCRWVRVDYDRYMKCCVSIDISEV